MRDPLAADINIPGFDDVHPIRPVYKTRYSHPDTGPKVPSLRNGPEIVVEKTRGPKATRLGCGKGTVKPEERDIALFQLEQ
ncbi:MAG: hypothetical protein LQ348_005903 [Seirophora lacunosa]|nr:MAG: hypothetical protein LQ348_005903 [Seirophora lacunosa]